MAKKYILNRKNVSAIIKSWYYLDGEYLYFPDNPINNTEYSNVDITICDAAQNYANMIIKGQLITITGHEPIFCELVNFSEAPNGKLTINICEDWG